MINARIVGAFGNHKCIFICRCAVCQRDFFHQNFMSRNILQHLGEASKKQNCFFFWKNSKIPRPPPPLTAVWRVQFFLIRKFWNWGDPLGEKFRNILSFFYDKIPIYWVKPPLLTNISKNSWFL